MSDRTGELCPFCKKGKLYPSGRREIVASAREPRSGETRRESTEYECDNCKRRTKALGISVAATITSTAEAKANGDTKKTKK
jgi:hypothetical protein